MLRKTCFIILSLAACAPRPAAGGEDIQAAIDSFLAKESTKIELARMKMQARMDERVADYNALVAEKYARSATPLHIAAQDGDLDRVRELILAGADIDAVMNYGATPLTLATTFNRLEVMECLLANGADPNAGEAIPLWEAAASRRVAAIRLLLRHGADPNAAISGGATPLSAAYFHLWSTPRARFHEALGLLLEAGADPDVYGGAPLRHARAAGDAETVELLLGHGATDSDDGPDDAPELPAPHRAARDGNLDLLRDLVQNGADVNQPDGVLGLTPAHYAAKSGRVDVLAWLAEHGADLAIRTRRPVDDIFLSAAMGGDIEVMRLCLAHGVPVDYQTELGTSVLAAVAIGAMVGRDWNTAAFLLENGADVNWRDDDGLTALHLAASAQLWDFDKLAMENLVRAGADPGALDSLDLSPLHYAAAMNNRRAMAVLLQTR